MENELMHHGILGMKWGVRRYQNKDGTLTSKGKARKQKKLNKTDKSKRQIKKKLKKMSDQELKDRINRLNLERQYKDLVKANYRTTKSKKFVESALKNGAKLAAYTGSAIALYKNSKAIKEIVSDWLRDY